jgi:hypothetical protein
LEDEPLAYVKTKYTHLERQTADHIKNLQISNQQMGMAIIQLFRERDAALAQVEVLKSLIKAA